MKTPISYYGGKQSIIRHILPLIPEHKVYTEVFFGGGTVFFAKEPATNETINDRLDIVVNFYRQVKTNFKQLKELIDSTLVSRSDFITAARIIQSPADEYPPIKRAWAFWVRANMGFANKLDGGLKFSNNQCTALPKVIRNKKNRFTMDLCHRLENVCIENIDALDILKSRNVKEAFHYIDPPYPNADNGHYKGYTWEDYKNLLTTMSELKGKFLQSSYNSDMLDQFIKIHGWHKKEVIHRIKTPRKSGSAKVEVLIMNYRPENIRDQLQIFP